MERALGVIGAVVFAILGLGTACATGETAPPYIGVAYSLDDSKNAEVRIAGEEITREFGMAAPKAMSRNPVCCVWLEVRASPLPSGYVIIHQQYGTVISASSPEQLRKAVGRFIESAVVRGGKKEVPVGLMTNYNIIEQKPKSESGGVGQPTAAPESKPEGKDKPQLEPKPTPR